MNLIFFTKESRPVFIPVFCFSIALMISPDTIVLLGNFVGRAGIKSFWIIILTVIVYGAIIYRFKKSGLFLEPRSGERGWHEIVLLFIRIIAVVFIATGLLVSSGFAFNEIFVYWFPNFGFAYLLLGILCILQFLGTNAVFNFQIVFSAIPVLGLVILVFSGLYQTGFQAFSNPGIPGAGQISPGPATLFLPLLLFVGFDLGFAPKNNIEANGKFKFPALAAAIMVMGILFILWGSLMTAYLPASKLAQTTIPHIITARKILGDPGRYIMGAMIIFGSLAAVHALFTSISEQLSQWMANWQTRKIIPEKLNRPKFVIILLAIIVGILMGAGLAGGETLEILIKAALVLWFLSYLVAFFHLNTGSN